MKKWIFISFVLLVIVLGFMIHLYDRATEPLKEGERIATKKVLSETDMVTISHFSPYFGSNAYYCIKGEDERGESLIAFVPMDDNGEKIFVFKEKDGISEEEAIQLIQKEKNPKEIIRVTLGMEQNIPVWEIYYRSDNDLINYYYLDFLTGKMIKNIQNL